MWYWLCWFLRLVDPTAPRPLALELDDSDARDGTDRVPSESPAAHDERSDRNAVRTIQDPFGAMVERAAALRPGAARASRRLKFFQMLRGDHRHARNATSRPPSERRQEIPSRVAHFRNSATPSVSKDGPTPRSRNAACSAVRPGGRPISRRLDALELVGGIHAAAARLRQVSYRTPLRKLRDDERARHSGFGALA